MNKPAFTTTAIWAIGTFALVLAISLPASLSAGDEAGRKLAVDKPTLTVNGVTLTVDVSGSSATGLNLTVNATNSGNASATATFTLNIMTTAVSSPMSRALPMPREQWRSDEQTTTLGPGQSGQIRLQTPGVNMDKQMLKLTLFAGSQAITVYTAAGPTGRQIQASGKSLEAGEVAQNGN